MALFSLRLIMKKRLTIVLIVLPLLAVSLVLALPLSNDSRMIPITDDSLQAQSEISSGDEGATGSGPDAPPEQSRIPDSALAAMLLLATGLIGVVGISRKKD